MEVNVSKPMTTSQSVEIKREIENYVVNQWIKTVEDQPTDSGSRTQALENLASYAGMRTHPF